MDADDLADYGRDSNVPPRDPEADAAHDDLSDEQRELYDNADDFHPYFIEVYSQVEPDFIIPETQDLLTKCPAT